MFGPPPPPGYGPPGAPFGIDPATGQPFSDKSKVVAGVLQIVPGFGIGRMYAGHVGLGVAQLALTLVTCGLANIWCLIDGIMILVNGGADSDGRPLHP